MKESEEETRSREGRQLRIKKNVKVQWKLRVRNYGGTMH